MRKDASKIIIAIDGHSSCGKSTVAKDIAKELSLTYIDTGAMYRAVTLFAIENNLFKNGELNSDLLNKHIPSIVVELRYNQTTKNIETWLNNKNVENKIRTLEVSNKVSEVSALGFVRERLVELQQEMGKNGGIVMDGRDIGTVVFPKADLKVFMTASPEVRAKRRYDEMKSKGENVSFNEVLNNVVKRDQIDSTRSESPLKQAEDALILDNSNITREGQLQWIMDQLKSKSLI